MEDDDKRECSLKEGQRRVGPTKIDSYSARLVEFYRPPSKGGNTRAWHRHAFQVDGDWYSFLALGAKKWIHVNDAVEFDWSWDDCGQYRNVDPDTIRTTDKNGKSVVRGERGTKKWRTAPARMPASRREQRD
jgi:hypothetical protein